MIEPRIELTTPDVEGEASDGFDAMHAAECDYQLVLENQVGRVIPDDAWQIMRERHSVMDAQTREIARALDSTGRCPGRPFDRGDNDAGRCTVIGLFSGEAYDLPPVKRVAFLPSVAAQNRAKMLKDIEHFIGGYLGNARLYTITSGPRVTIDGVIFREKTRDFHRWLSKMAAGPDFKRWGIKMQWRATEFGSPHWDAETGKMTLHLHAHCLVTEPEGFTGKKRGMLRRRLWRVLGVHWDDGGTIANAREFVKYPVKPADLETILRQGGPGVLADFYQAIRGLHIVQPMADLRLIRANRKRNGRRITAFSRGDGRTLEETGDWNAMKRPLAGKKKHRVEMNKRAKALAKKMGKMPFSEEKTVLNPQLNSSVAAEMGMLKEGGENRPDELAGKSPPPKNRIIARLAPAPYGSAVNEPAVVVWGFDGNISAVLAQPFAARIIARHGAAFDDAQAARALIRACADAQARAHRAASKSSQRSNNCPADLGDLALADIASESPPGPNGAFFAEKT